MLYSIHTLLPDFAIIALGGCIAGLLSHDIWRGLDRLSYFVLYPALIFHAASARAIELGSVLTLGGAAAGVVTTGLILGLCTRRFVTLVLQSSVLGIATLPLWTTIALNIAEVGPPKAFVFHNL